MNTDAVLGHYLSDDVLKEYRYNPKEKMDIVNPNKLYHYPLMKGGLFQFNQNKITYIIDDLDEVQEKIIISMIYS